MALLPARTTTENAVIPEGSARSAAAMSPQSPGRNVGPSTVAQAARAGGASRADPDQKRSEVPPKHVEDGKAPILLTSASTSGVAEITARDPASIALRDAGSQGVGSVSPSTTQVSASDQLTNTA